MSSGKTRTSWVGAVMACELALDAGDKQGAIRAHCVLSRLAGQRKARRKVVHDYGNRIQHLIFARWLAEQTDDTREALDPGGEYVLHSAEVEDAV